MPLILALETSTRLCSVALGRDGVVLADRDVESECLEHAEKVNVLIAEVLEEAGVGMKDLHAVAVGIGPGSYTGLRIGLSVAKGLCHALGVPIIGVGTLDVLAAAGGVVQGVSYPMIDARRMEVFTAAFRADRGSEEEPYAVVLDDAWASGIHGCTVLGDGADKSAELWSRHPSVRHLFGVRPYARAMLGLAEERMRQAMTDDLAYLVPKYGKEARVTQPSKRNRTGS